MYCCIFNVLTHLESTLPRENHKIDQTVRDFKMSVMNYFCGLDTSRLIAWLGIKYSTK